MPKNRDHRLYSLLRENGLSFFDRETCVPGRVTSDVVCSNQFSWPQPRPSGFKKWIVTASHPPVRRRMPEPRRLAPSPAIAGPPPCGTCAGSTRTCGRSSTGSARAGWSRSPTGSARWSARSSASRSRRRPPRRSTGGSSAIGGEPHRPGAVDRARRGQPADRRASRGSRPAMCSTWPRPSPPGRSRSTSSTTPGTTQAITEALTAIKGIGVWTAEMFLIFALNRPDVLPASDLGVRVGLRDRHGLAELPKPRDCHALAEPWRPYRTHRELVPLEGRRHARVARPSPSPSQARPRVASAIRRVHDAEVDRAMTFDLIMKGGWVIDGSGGPPFRADVGAARDDDRRGRPARRRRGRARPRRRPDATSSPASSTPTSTATSCSWPTRSICRPCARA